MITIALLLLVIVGRVACNDIYFNDVSECDGTGGCNWDDTTIWVGGVVPALQTDFVYINTTRPDIRVLYNSNNQIYLGGLFLSNVSLIILNASLGADTVRLEYSFLEVGLLANVTSGVDTQILFNSALYLRGGRFEQEASDQFVLDDTSTIIVEEWSSIILNSLVLLSGTLDLARTSTFIGETVFFYSSNTIPNCPYIGTVAFVSSEVNFTQGLVANEITLFTGSQVSIYQTLGVVSSLTIDYNAILYLRSINAASNAAITSVTPNSGTLYISSSSLTLSNGHMPLQINLVLAGQVYLSLTAIQIYSLSFENGDNAENPYINISITQDPVMFYLDNVVIPGEILIDNSFVTFVGSSTLTSGILSLAGVLMIEGSLTTFGPIILVTEPPFVPTVILEGGAILTTPLLHIREVTLLEIADDSTIVGELINSGIMNIYGRDTLSILGNYTQSAHGQVVFSQMEPINNEIGFINVTGRAKIDGTMSYSATNATEAENSLRFLILYASGGVDGTFSSTVNQGAGDASVKLEYSSRAVSFVYGKDTPGDEPKKDRKPLFGLVWWTWLLIAAGGVVVVLAVPFIFYTTVKKSRNSYVPLE